MDRYASGDDAAFGDVYDAVAPRVFAYLRRQTRDTARAEDLVQQTSANSPRPRHLHFREAACCHGHSRSRAAHDRRDRRDRRNVLTAAEAVVDDHPSFSSDAPPDGLAEAKELAHRLDRELKRLPESQRIAFELMRVDGLSHVEAAEVLGATVSAVKLRAHRAYVRSAPSSATWSPTRPKPDSPSRQAVNGEAPVAERFLCDSTSRAWCVKKSTSVVRATSPSTSSAARARSSSE